MIIAHHNRSVPQERGAAVRARVNAAGHRMNRSLAEPVGIVYCLLEGLFKWQVVVYVLNSCYLMSVKMESLIVKLHSRSICGSLSSPCSLMNQMRLLPGALGRANACLAAVGAGRRSA